MKAIGGVIVRFVSAGLGRLVALASLIVVVFGAAAPAWAQEKIALVIGNGDYATSRWDLRSPVGGHTPVNDARLMAETLGELGFADVVVVENASRERMIEAVEAFGQALRKAGPDAVGFFYFTGHAQRIDGENYLFPIDLKADYREQVRTRAFNAAEVFLAIGSAPEAAASFVVLDACQDAGLPAQQALYNAEPGGLAAPAPPQTLGRWPRVLIGFATQPGEFASAGSGKHSPYTKALSDALRANAAASATDIFESVTSAVATATAGGDRPQRPYYVSHLGRVYRFKEAAPSEPRLIRRTRPDGTVEELTTGGAPSTPTMDPSLEVFKLLASACEYAAFARDYPTSSAAALARTRAGGARPCDEGPSAREITTRIQTALIAMGCLEGAADGAAGPATRAGAARFRAAKGQSGTALDAAFMAAVEAASSEGFACPAIEPSPLPSARPAPQPAPFATATGRRAGEEFRDCSDCPVMVVIPGGSFTMGSPAGEADRRDNEGPQRTVTIAEPFAVGKFEVTWAEWDACVRGGGCGGYTPGDAGWGKGSRPVINVSWEDAQAYVGWLSSKTGEDYRLLSEAEWEYAARAGTTGRFSNNGAEAQLCQIANHADQLVSYSWKNTACSDGVGEQTAPVGRFAVNPFGLHDMHGNVWEWVEDCYRDSYETAPTDGSAVRGDRPGTDECSSLRVLRGGSWFNVPQTLRSAYRSRINPTFRYSDLGFRLARTVSP